MLLADENARRDIVSEIPSTHPVAGRALICSTVAVIEGLVAAILIFAVAATYHLGLLGATLGEFASAFYASFSVLTGAGYAMLSAIGCSRFLDGDQRRQDGIASCLASWTGAIAITLLTAFLAGKVGEVSRVTLTIAYVTGCLLLPALRGAIYARIARRISSGKLNFERIAVIGRKADVANFLINGELWRRGHVLTGALYIDGIDEGGALDDQAVTEFARENLKRGADHVVLLGDLSDMDALEHLVETIKRFALNFIYAPATANNRLKFLDVVTIGPNNALRFVQKPMADGAVLLKRAMDVTLSSIGLILLAPVFLVVAIAIAMDSPGPIFFRQARRGFNGETFMIWKFRTMTVTESGYKMVQAKPDDARVTRVGGLLRRTSIDELPQLINVMGGEMSLVGPRPHAVSHDDELSRRVANYAHRQRIKPGITGWAQVHGFRGETATMQQIEGRVVHDIHYIENWSIFLDFWTLILTVVSPLSRKNAN
jgi:Undecaprenyl-phosphate glucose phosphotransferase